MIKPIALVLMLASGMQGDLPPDRKVGRTVFHVDKSSGNGEDATLSPLMVPSFAVERISGDHALDTGIIQCDVYERILSRDEVKKVVIAITILKCSGNEYGVAQVNFVMEDDK